MSLIVQKIVTGHTLGLVFNYSGLPLPETVDNLLKVLGGASLPLGLLAVGAGLNIQAARSAQWTVLQSSFVKLLLVPILTLLIGIYLGVSGPVLATVVLFNALPCTPSAYIMAKLLGGDYQLSASIITIQTLLAAVTIPLMLMLTQL
ncbi:AEC family transporter [Dickeya dianthicola]|uniref:AEC family transporter n=1 Tax=Dickeya dianthicola TaxID=204039 RepID=UPI00301B5B89